MSDDRPRSPFELRFALGPIPVAITPGFWLMGLIFGLAGGSVPVALVWVAVVFFSVLVHELGHAVAALAQGTRASIELWSLGGRTMPEKALSRAGDVVMSLCGPLAGFVVGGLAWLVSRFWLPENELGRLAFVFVEWVNVVWGAVNLMPLLPLDGGHILLGLLGPKRHKIVFMIGVGVGAVAAALLGFWKLYWGAFLMGMFAWQNWRTLSEMKRLAQQGSTVISVGDALQQGWDALRRGQADQALRIGRVVLDQAPDPEARNRARDLVAWADLSAGEYRDALRQLERSEPPQSARALTWAMVLEALREPGQAAPYALSALEVEPSETAASLAVRVLAAAKRFDEAQAVLERFAWPRDAVRQASRGELDFAHGEFAGAARAWSAAFDATGEATHAYDAACAFARAGDRAGALLHLERALKAGWADRELLRTDEDLALLRGSPELEQLLSSMPHA